MQIDPEIKNAARSLWDYLKLNQVLAPCDCIIAMGSHDLRTAEYAARLQLEGWAPWLVCSGGLGRLTQTKWQEPEAQKFARIAVDAGVPASQILVEDQSNNTGQNILFSKKKLAEAGLKIRSALLVHKPYMERRAIATAQKVWPEVECCVTSPPISFEDYPTDEIPMKQLIHIMVGDFQRILVYGQLGFQVEQNVPNKVKEAYEDLVQTGFTKQMIPADI